MPKTWSRSAIATPGPSIAVSLGASAAYAEGSAGDLFSKLLQVIPLSRAACGHLQGWLYGAVRNTAIDWIRRQGKVAAALPEEDLVPDDDMPSQSPEKRQQQAQLRKAIRQPC